jgi:hypothetical protein
MYACMCVCLYIYVCVCVCARARARVCVYVTRITPVTSGLSDCECLGIPHVTIETNGA